MPVSRGAPSRTLSSPRQMVSFWILSTAGSSSSPRQSWRLPILSSASMHDCGLAVVKKEAGYVSDPYAGWTISGHAPRSSTGYLRNAWKARTSLQDADIAADEPMSRSAFPVLGSTASHHAPRSCCAIARSHTKNTLKEASIASKSSGCRGCSVMTHVTCLRAFEWTDESCCIDGNTPTTSSSSAPRSVSTATSMMAFFIDVSGDVSGNSAPNSNDVGSKTTSYSPRGLHAEDDCTRPRPGGPPCSACSTGSMVTLS